jgi:hypothetical protein
MTILHIVNKLVPLVSTAAGQADLADKPHTGSAQLKNGVDIISITIIETYRLFDGTYCFKPAAGNIG